MAKQTARRTDGTQNINHKNNSWVWETYILRMKGDTSYLNELCNLWMPQSEYTGFSCLDHLDFSNSENFILFSLFQISTKIVGNCMWII